MTYEISDDVGNTWTCDHEQAARTLAVMLANNGHNSVTVRASGARNPIAWYRHDEDGNVYSAYCGE
jgi:hypothetical protein